MMEKALFLSTFIHSQKWLPTSSLSLVAGYGAAKKYCYVPVLLASTSATRTIRAAIYSITTCYCSKSSSTSLSLMLFLIVIIALGIDQQ